jgi:hypothetical protein
LRGSGNLSREKYGAGAGTENWLPLAESAQRLEQVFEIDQLKHSGALPAGNNQAIARSQISRGTDFNGVHIGSPQRPHVRAEVTLKGENAYVLQSYQPRV